MERMEVYSVMSDEQAKFIVAVAEHWGYHITYEFDGNTFKIYTDEPLENFDSVSGWVGGVVESQLYLNGKRRR